MFKLLMFIEDILICCLAAPTSTRSVKVKKWGLPVVVKDLVLCEDFSPSVTLRPGPVWRKYWSRGQS